MTDHSTDRDVLDVLFTDHREMTELIGEIRAASDPAAVTHRLPAVVSP